MKLDISRLVNVKKNPDQSFNCQCPICFRDEGQDKSGRNHLRIWPNGSFNCITHNEDRFHNAKIRAFLRGTNPDENPDFEYLDPEPKITVEKIFPDSCLEALIPDYEYWRGRGIKEEPLRLFQCGLALKEEKSKLSGRVVFPVRNIEGRIIGFSARLIGDNSFAPKWKILGKKNHFIFPSINISKPAIQADGSVILVEGIGCCLKLAQNNIFNTLCLFGLNISGKQISYLISLGVKRVIIATNNEASGIGNQAAEKLKTKLCAFFNEENVVIKLPVVKDFMCLEDEMVKKWAEDAMK